MTDTTALQAARDAIRLAIGCGLKEHPPGRVLANLNAALTRLDAAIAAEAVPQPWDRERAISMIAEERIALLGEDTRTFEQERRLQSLNADMEALCPRVNQSMVDQMREITERLIAATAKPPQAPTAQQVEERGAWPPCERDDCWLHDKCFGHCAAAKAASSAPTAQQEPADETDDLLLALGLPPERYRTEGGALNLPKIKAAIQHPDEYPRLELADAMAERAIRGALLAAPPPQTAESARLEAGHSVDRTGMHRFDAGVASAAYASPQTADAQPVASLLQSMIVSATQIVDGDEVVGYQIKTGSLHKLVGLFPCVVFPSNLPSAHRAEVATITRTDAGWKQARVFGVVVASRYGESGGEDQTDIEALVARINTAAQPPASQDDARDAARYRWLQEHTVATGLSRWMGHHQFLDAAIDSAIASTAKEQS